MAAPTNIYSYPLTRRDAADSIASTHFAPRALDYASQHHSPGSPPELTTSSKSSKSSSLRSSSLGPVAVQDLAHFEDITLDDVQGDSYARKMSEDCVAAGKTRANVGARMIGGRDLMKGQNGLGQTREATRAPQVMLGLPPKMMKRRRKQALPQLQPSMSTPALQMGMRSRSMSPISPSNFAISHRPPRTSSGGPPLERVRREGPIARGRGPWQPGRRKTVKELEDEYDDNDEDLPEDAIVWNVPISPRPPTERQKSPSPRQSSSVSPSPSDLRGVLGLGLDFSASGTPMVVNKATPKSPRIPLSNAGRSGSMTSIPENYSHNPRPATKTWDATLCDLSAEARMLTQALEEHAEASERAVEEAVQSRQSSPKREVKRAVSASTVELPPMRKGDMAIDPLPCSKEKEKFLTRTRPSWLPPKDPEEEKRHLKEYQKMMARSLEAEKKKAKLQQVAQCRRDDTKETLAKLWQESVLPHWDERVKDPKTREIWWKGITPRDRGEVWSRAAGNALGLTESSYNLALERARNAEKRIATLSTTDVEHDKEAQWFAAIRRDVKEAFPELMIFQMGGPLHQTLLDVLMAYTMYVTDVGYIHGIHYPAALLVLNLPAPASFLTLANLLNRPLPSAFLSAGSSTPTPPSQSFVTSTLQKLALHSPTLHKHLTPFASTLLAPLYTSLLASSLTGLDLASRIWDIYVFEGDAVLVAAAAAILLALEPALYGDAAEIADVLSRGTANNLLRDMGEEEFVRRVRVCLEGKAAARRRPSSW